MEVFKIILLVGLIGLTLWLIIDTTIWFIKRFKQRKLEKLKKQNDEVINNDENK